METIRIRGPYYNQEKQEYTFLVSGFGHRVEIQGTEYKKVAGELASYLTCNLMECENKRYREALEEIANTWGCRDGYAASLAEQALKGGE